MPVDYARVNNTLGKMDDALRKHKCICVSVSGGSDSDIIVHMICAHFPQYLPKIKFVFANTGIEYRATLQHLADLEEKYGITIERLRGIPIPAAVKKYGVPFISKQFSDYLQRLQKHYFSWEDGTFEKLWAKYPRCKVGIRFWTNDFGKKSRFNINWVIWLKEFLMQRKPETRFSAMCCNVSKKGPLTRAQQIIGADLYITGERKVEGGVRTKHKSCFEESKKHKIAHYMPLLFWNDDTKAWYKEKEGVRYSDCYEVYGLKRTGCVGCPYGQNLWDELEVMQKYEPALYKVCWNVFGESYQLRKEFEQFRSEVKNK